MKTQITFGITAIVLVALTTTCWCNHLNGKIADANTRYAQDAQDVEHLKKEIAITHEARMYHERLADELAKEPDKIHELNSQNAEKIKAMEAKLAKLSKAKEREQLLANVRRMQIEGALKASGEYNFSEEEKRKRLEIQNARYKQHLESLAVEDRRRAEEARKIKNFQIKMEWNSMLKQAEKEKSRP